jgi:triosephosphate isomerase
MRYFIGSNIKIYLTPSEALKWIRAVDLEIPETDEVDVALFPPLLSLVKAPGLITRSNLSLGAQNVAFEERGALTGETSVLAVKELGVPWVELGHHERRLYFNETEPRVRRKAELALANGLRVLACLGEDEGNRRGSAAEFVTSQTRSLVKGLALDDPSRLVIAYEPRWAIGVDSPASPEHAGLCARAIRRALETHLGEVGAGIRIIYGGSLRLQDAVQILRQESIHGLFIGRSALHAETFAKFVGVAREQFRRDESRRARAK